MEIGSGRKILIIEDETDVADLLTLNLRKAGFRTSTAADGASGLQKARDDRPDFLILDLMLPKMSGLEVCRILKSDTATAQIPILMLTAKAEEVDRIVGLEFGADDYVTKPFSPREIVLRIRAIFRRGEKPDESLKAGPVSIDLARHQVRVNGKQVHLTVAAGGGARDRNRARRAAADISDSRRRRDSTYRVTPGKDFQRFETAQQADRKTRIGHADHFLCDARRIAGGRFQPSSDSD